MSEVKGSANIASGIKEGSASEMNSIDIDALARFAVDEHNKKGSAHLEFEKVLNSKEELVAGTMYNITLEATDGGKKNVYEAKVWVKLWLNFKELQEFKQLLESDA